MTIPADHKCSCQPGGRETVILPRPDFLEPGERPNGIPVDACIAETVQDLWACGIHTLGSCCGHNKENPSVVLSNVTAGIDQSFVRKVIATHDERPWDLYQWKLVLL